MGLPEILITHSSSHYFINVNSSNSPFLQILQKRSQKTNNIIFFMILIIFLRLLILDIKIQYRMNANLVKRLLFSSVYSKNKIILQHKPNSKLPIQNQKNILITAALPYVNNTPHLGNIIGAVLSADTYARFCRLRGYNTLYVCGTDQYGTTTEVKALKEKVSPKEICDKYNSLHRQIYQYFNISYDVFGRTSHAEHTKQTQEIFEQLFENGFIQKKKVKQFYCNNCKISLADRYIKGTCSKCGSNNAKGDQCDDCSTLFKDPLTQIINPQCHICSQTPVVHETQHMYFKVTSLFDSLSEWIGQKQNIINWSANAKGITNGWLKGLQDRCITRNLKWGVPVPPKYLYEKVFYVWFQAPLGYISMTRKVLEEGYEKWWKNSQNTNIELCQFMGKDNVIFHSIINPATMIGTNQNWIKPYRICATQYLMYEGGKFSKSRGIGIFGNDCEDTQIESDVWRYYLLINRPEHFDSQFSWKAFVQRNNKDLVNSIGNLFNRVLKYVYKNYKGQTISLSNVSDLQEKLINQLSQVYEQYLRLMEKVQIKSSAFKVLQYSHILNKYLQDSQFWNKQNKQSGKTYITMAISLRCFSIYSQIIYPFLPVTSLRISQMLGENQDFSQQLFNQNQSFRQRIFENSKGYTINTEPYLLFRQISPEKEDELIQKYGSNKNTIQ